MDGNNLEWMKIKEKERNFESKRIILKERARRSEEKREKEKKRERKKRRNKKRHKMEFMNRK